MKKLVILFLMVALVITLNSPTFSIEINNDYSFVVNINKILTIPETKEFFSRDKNIEKVKNFLASHIKNIGITGTFEKKSKNFIFFISGQFHINKIVKKLDEIGINAITLKLGKDKVYGLTFEKVAIILTDNFIVVSSKDNSNFETEVSARHLFKYLNDINKNYILKIYFAMNKNIKRAILNKINDKSPQLVKEFIGNVQTLNLILNMKKMEFIIGMDVKNGIKSIGAMRVFIGLGNMLLTYNDGEILRKLQKESILTLLSESMIGKTNSIKFGKNISKKLSIVENGKKIKFSIFFPEKKQVNKTWFGKLLNW